MGGNCVSETIGTKGPRGYNGWTPTLEIVADGADRQVLQLVGYHGGTGPVPTINIDDYLTVDGYTSDISLATNIKGDKGDSVTVESYTNEELRDLITEELLTPGTLYKITDYKTKHLIPNTTVINEGPTEQLILQAISTSQFSPVVFSVDNPTDIIHYDINDILVEDDVTNRNGFITYRKDTVNNLSTHYDFRAVKLRRWGINFTSITWEASTAYLNKNLLYNDGSLYVIRKDFTSGLIFDDTDLLDISQSDYGFVMNDTLKFGETTFTKSGDYDDYYTFNETCSNINIARCLFTYTGATNASTINNIVLLPGEATYGDITIESNCKDITILPNVSDITIKSSCNNLVLKDVRFGTIKEQSRNNLLSSVHEFTIGANTNNNILITAYKIELDSANSTNIIVDATQVSIGNFSQFNEINHSWRITLGKYSVLNRIVNACTEITIGDTSQSNIIEHSNKVDLKQNCASNELLNVYNGEIGSSSSGNILTGTEIKLGMNSDTNTIDADDVVLGNNCGTNSITGATYRVSLSNGCKNNYIKDAINLVFGQACSNNGIVDTEISGVQIVFGEFCKDNKVYLCNNVILQGENRLNVLTGDGNIGGVKGVNINLAIQAYENTITDSISITVGINGHHNQVVDCVTCTFGDNSIYNELDTVIQGSFGFNTAYNVIEKVSAIVVKDNASNNEVGDISQASSNQIIIGEKATYNTISYNCTNIELGMLCQNNDIAYTCSVIKLGNGSINNTIGNSSNTIQFGVVCSNNVIAASSSLINFIGYVSGKTFSNAIGSISIAIPSETTQVIALAGFQEIVVDKRAPDDYLWYKKIDNSGVETATTKLV